MSSLPSVPRTQRAVIITQFGDPDVLTYQDDAPVPQLQDADSDQVLVKVAYAGINPVEYKTRQGKGWGADNIKKNQFANNEPAILGFDMAGEVVACSSDKFSVGDKVAALNFAGGCYAEYTVVDAKLLTHIPSGVDLKSAGAVPCVGTTAKQLIDFAAIQAGEHVVISAPAGGVGHLALQMLINSVKDKHIKLTVICSADKYDKLNTLIDVDLLEGWIDYTRYTKDDAYPKLNADLLLDLVGDDAGVKALNVLKSGGRAIVLPSIWVDKIKSASQDRDNHINVTGFAVDPNKAGLGEVLAMLAEGTIKLHIQSVYPLKDTSDAHRELEKGDTFGKIVLQI